MIRELDPVRSTTNSANSATEVSTGRFIGRDVVGRG
jgi:hypothetical protein